MRRQILGLGVDGPRRSVELDTTPANQSLVATPSGIAHRPKVYRALE
jgi:hypothetical protein